MAGEDKQRPAMVGASLAVLLGASFAAIGWASPRAEALRELSKLRVSACEEILLVTPASLPKAGMNPGRDTVYGKTAFGPDAAGVGERLGRRDTRLRFAQAPPPPAREHFVVTVANAADADEPLFCVGRRVGVADEKAVQLVAYKTRASDLFPWTPTPDAQPVHPSAPPAEVAQAPAASSSALAGSGTSSPAAPEKPAAKASDHDAAKTYKTATIAFRAKLAIPGLAGLELSGGAVPAGVCAVLLALLAFVHHQLAGLLEGRLSEPGTEAVLFLNRHTDPVLRAASLAMLLGTCLGPAFASAAVLAVSEVPLLLSHPVLAVVIAGFFFVMVGRQLAFLETVWAWRQKI